MKKWLKNIAALLFGTGVALVILELFLHIYNPFQIKIRGEKISLPCNQKYEFEKVSFRGLDSHIVHTKNKQGFRGPDWNSDATYRILFVGGSTTECYYLSDGKDWPSVCMQLVQQNAKRTFTFANAGLDGHSTRGHILLLRDFIKKINPTHVVFLIGANDVASDELNKFENENLNQNKRFLQNFELYNIYHNYKMSKLAKKRGVSHRAVDFANLKSIQDSTPCKIPALTEELENYKSRVKTLIEICNENKCTPVFISQTSMASPTSDDLQNSMYWNLPFQNNTLGCYYRTLHAYNAALQAISTEHKVSFINGEKLGADTNYFYDYFHFTNAGSVAMGKFVSQELKSILGI